VSKSGPPSNYHHHPSAHFRQRWMVHAWDN
jgi:hypothetical protein